MSDQNPVDDTPREPQSPEAPDDSPVADPTPSDVRADEVLPTDVRADEAPADEVRADEPLADETFAAPESPAEIEFEPEADEPLAGTATGEVIPAEPPAPGSAMAGQVVYVQAPVPPRLRSNRVIGVVLALVGAVLFAFLYAGVVAAMIALSFVPESVSEEIGDFLSDAAFWVPVLFFALGFVLIVLLLNRAAWWLHVLGSLLVALVVYFGTIGMLLFINNAVTLSPAEASTTFSTLAVNPVIVAAALVAREVSIWVGFLIAVRGRKVAARNTEARTAFDREQLEKKAEYERAAAQG